MERNRQGIDLPENRTRSALLAADVDGQLVGRASIRFELNDFLAFRGGHIRYDVISAFRRKGYATDILRHSIVIARNEGVTSLLVTCDDSDVGSTKVIERCGGVLETTAVDEWDTFPSLLDLKTQIPLPDRRGSQMDTLLENWKRRSNDQKYDR